MSMPVSEAKFEQSDCAAFQPLKTILAGSSIDAVLPARCGYLIVPESRVGRTDAHIRLPVVIAEATSTPPDKDVAKRPAPLVMVTGGPGGSSLGFVGALAKGAAFSELRRDRDVILVNERGVLHSEPQLNCSEFDDLARNVFGNDGNVHPVTPEESREAAQRCYQRLTVEAGVDLASYNTSEMAADVHDAVGALGYVKYNIYGVSFGTLLTQHVVQRFPDNIESIILDSPVTLDGNIVFDVGRSVNDALQALFAACREDMQSCDAKYPELDKTLFKLVADLESQKPAFQVLNPKDGKTYAWNLTGGMVFQEVVNNMKQSVIPVMPQLIYAMKAGVLKPVEDLVAQGVVPVPDESAGMRLSVECSEWAFGTPDQIPTEGIDETVQRFIGPAAADKLRACEVWPVPRVQKVFPEVYKPLESASLPALIMPARFDANTHPKKGPEIASHLPKAFVHTFPDRGHVVIGPCAISMMNAFISDPSKDPDTACLKELTIKWQ